jgi:hypothetical protein
MTRPGAEAEAQPVTLDADFVITPNARLLHHDAQQGCWVLDIYRHPDDSPDRLGRNAALTSPDDLAAAQRWVTARLTGGNETGFTNDAESTWTITEWVLADVDGQTGWMPLYNVTDRRSLPFAARSPYAGARADPAMDNLLWVGRDRGGSSMHPLGTELLRGTRAETAELLSAELAVLSPAAWLVPAARDRVLTDYAAIFVEHAIISGHGYVDILREHHPDPLRSLPAKRITAAALRHHHGQTPPIPHYQDRLRTASHRFTDRSLQLNRGLARYHPGTVHDDLAALAIAGQRRRTRPGRMLVSAHLALIASGNISAYAPAGSLTSRAFYQRLGFIIPETAQQIPSDTAGPHAGAPVWPCHRPAARRGRR